MQKPQTLEEWYEAYKVKTGIPVNQKPYKRLKYFPKMGFMLYGIIDQQLLICETAGDGTFWYNMAKKMAKENNCTEISTVIYCNPEAYMRRFKGAKVAGTVMTMEVD